MCFGYSAPDYEPGSSVTYLVTFEDTRDGTVRTEATTVETLGDYWADFAYGDDGPLSSDAARAAVMYGPEDERAQIAPDPDRHSALIRTKRIVEKQSGKELFSA